MLHDGHAASQACIQAAAEVVQGPALLLSYLGAGIATAMGCLLRSRRSPGGKGCKLLIIQLTQTMNPEGGSSTGARGLVMSLVRAPAYQAGSSAIPGERRDRQGRVERVSARACPASFMCSALATHTTPATSAPTWKLLLHAAV